MTEIVRDDCIVSGRPLETVLLTHEIDVAIFQGKVVLDLGCGLSDLGSDLDDMGIDATVIGLDAFPYEGTRQTGGPKATSKIIADLGSRFPISDSSIDIALATWSFPMWAGNAPQVDSFFKECKRVVKPQGLLSVVPILVAEVYGNSPPTSDEVSNMRRATKTQVMKIHLSRNWRTDGFKEDLLKVTKV